MPNELTRIAEIGGLPDLVRQMGGSGALEKIFRRQGLPTEILQTPFRFITRRDLCGLYESAARLLGDRSLGLRTGQRFEPELLSMRGRYMLCAPSLAGMINRCQRVIALYQKRVVCGLEVERDLARFWYRSNSNDIIGSRHIAERDVFVLLKLVRSIMGPSWRPLRVEVEYPPSSIAHDLEDTIGVPVHYDRPASALVFPRGELSARRPMRSPRKDISLGEINKSMQTPPPNTISAATRAVLEIRALTGRDDIAETARALGLGLRTFQRRLKEEGYDYRGIRNAVHLERALALLKERSLSIEAVAASLGYANSSHFTRAFAAWTGQSPSALRREL